MGFALVSNGGTRQGYHAIPQRPRDRDAATHPVQARSLNPALAPYLPAGQRSGIDVPKSQKWPLVQATHCACLERLVELE
eukprot:7376795-Prymnesium_polylepis.1